MEDRVHLSSEAAARLTFRDSIFAKQHVVPRGAVLIKGKGIVQTHWLLGRAAEALKWKEDGGAIASAHRRNQRKARNGYRQVQGPLTNPGKYPPPRLA